MTKEHLRRMIDEDTDLQAFSYDIIKITDEEIDLLSFKNDVYSNKYNLIILGNTFLQNINKSSEISIFLSELNRNDLFIYRQDEIDWATFTEDITEIIFKYRVSVENTLLSSPLMKEIPPDPEDEQLQTDENITANEDTQEQKDAQDSKKTETKNVLSMRERIKQSAETDNIIKFTGKQAKQAEKLTESTTENTTKKKRKTKTENIDDAVKKKSTAKTTKNKVTDAKKMKIDVKETQNDTKDTKIDVKETQNDAKLKNIKADTGQDIKDKIIKNNEENLEKIENTTDISDIKKTNDTTTENTDKKAKQTKISEKTDKTDKTDKADGMTENITDSEQVNIDKDNIENKITNDTEDDITEYIDNIVAENIESGTIENDIEDNTEDNEKSIKNDIEDDTDNIVIGEIENNSIDDIEDDINNVQADNEDNITDIDTSSTKTDTKMYTSQETATDKVESQTATSHEWDDKWELFEKDEQTESKSEIKYIMQNDEVKEKQEIERPAFRLSGEEMSRINFGEPYERKKENTIGDINDINDIDDAELSALRLDDIDEELHNIDDTSHITNDDYDETIDETDETDEISYKNTDDADEESDKESDDSYVKAKEKKKKVFDKSIFTVKKSIKTPHKTRKKADRESEEKEIFTGDVGFFGSTDGVGTTYIAMFLAEKLSNIKNTAYVDMTDKNYTKLKYLKENNIISYNVYNKKTYIDAIREKADVIIYDFGKLDLNTNNNIVDFERCSKKYIVVNPDPLKFLSINTVYEYLNKNANFTAIFNFTSDDKANKLKKEYKHLDIITLPYMTDNFDIISKLNFFK